MKLNIINAILFWHLVVKILGVKNFMKWLATLLLKGDLSLFQNNSLNIQTFLIDLIGEQV